jgi:metal-responsive CopG/Arc/MetJ family transcriptional regulator
MPSEKPFLSFVVPEELLSEIDTFRFTNRFPSRAAAIIWLIEWGLKNNEKQVEQRK